MKKIILVISLFLVTGISTSAFSQNKEKSIVYFKSNMNCSKCENTLNEYLKFEKGVKDLKVDHVSNTIYINYKKNKNTEQNLASAIRKKGYKAEKISKEMYDELTSHAKEKKHDHEHESHRNR